MINDLIKFANHLDSKGLHKEADYLDAVIKKESQDLSGMIAKVMPIVLNALMPMAQPMIQVMTERCVKDITSQAMDECFGGMSDKASVFFSGGISSEQEACITNVAASVLQQKLSDPALVKDVVMAGMSKLPGTQSIPLKPGLKPSSISPSQMASSLPIIGSVTDAMPL